MAPRSQGENHGSSGALSNAELARISADVLGNSPLPALVLEVPSQRIVATSLRAAQLLVPEGGEVVGRTMEDFTADTPQPGRDLFAGGQLNGFETIRILRRRQGADVSIRMWIRRFDHQPASDYVLVVLVAMADKDTDTRGAGHDYPAVVGTADSSLLIERISSDAENLFQRSVTDLLGTSLLGLVAESDVSDCLRALGEASASQRGVTLTVAVGVSADAAAETLRCEILLLPLEPAPSCAFVILPMSGGVSGIAVSDDLSAILARLGRGAQIAELARGIFRGISERDLPGLGKLTTRELEIVTSLLEGDRAPGIAAKLFLSQSTVRNHLSAIFAKLGVGSQQELIDRFRGAQSARERR